MCVFALFLILCVHCLIVSCFDGCLYLLHKQVPPQANLYQTKLILADLGYSCVLPHLKGLLQLSHDPMVPTGYMIIIQNTGSSAVGEEGVSFMSFCWLPAGYVKFALENGHLQLIYPLNMVMFIDFP